MHNLVCRLYGEHDLRLEDVSVAEPSEGQVALTMGAGGICGSDLHYYNDGGFGPIRVREPIILGHEASGFVSELGAGVEHLSPGELVAINPSQPCGHCEFCRQGMPMHCIDMHFMGSAMRMPHEQGVFRQRMLVNAEQCVPMGGIVSASEAACCEPLSVGLHALTQAGDLKDKRILVTGAGPIGALLVGAARHAGAQEIVVTDLQDFTLEVAVAMGASRTVNVARDPDGLDSLQEGKGRIDVAFECSASPQAIDSALKCLKPRGTLIQVGVAGEASVPLNMLVGKEIVYRGSHRFHEEFVEAARLIADRTIDVRPIITGTYPLSDATEAFACASDRARACKVQLALDPTWRPSSSAEGRERGVKA
jgi:L-idonate 5-dehydrogenase